VPAHAVLQILFGMSELTQRRVAANQSNGARLLAGASSTHVSATTAASPAATNARASHNNNDNNSNTSSFPPVPSVPPPPIPATVDDTTSDSSSSSLPHPEPHPILGHTPVPPTIAAGSVLNNLFRLNAEGEEQPRQLLALAIISIPFLRAAFARDSDEPQVVSRIPQFIHIISIAMML
jgi:hypothetical protein